MGFLNPISCILWIIVGGIAGGLARQLMASHSQGVASDIVLGIFGAIIGGFLLGLLNVSVGGCLGDLFAATLGACVVIGVGRMIMHRAVTV